MYSFMRRAFPARSSIGVIHAAFAVQVTLAWVTTPLSSRSVSGVPRVALAALFQFVIGTTPALSVDPMGTALLPSNFTPIAPLPLATGPVGTTWIPFTGARRVPVAGKVGV